MAKAINFDEVADIYDYYVTTDLDLNFFLSELSKQEAVLELMCGTGRVSVPLIQNGIKLTCVDYAPKMLEKLQSKLNQLKLEAELIEGDVRQLKLGKHYDKIFIPFNSFMELTDKPSQLQTLVNIYDHLDNNGLFICTLHNPRIRVQQATGEKIPRGEFNLPGNRRLQLHSIEYHNDGENIIYGTQTFSMYHGQHLEWVRELSIKFSLIEHGEFLKMAADVGFKMQWLHGDYQRTPFTEAKSPFMIYGLGK